MYVFGSDRSSVVSFYTRVLLLFVNGVYGDLLHVLFVAICDVAQ